MVSWAEKLGFAPDDRVVLLHADDLGMCHAANTAFAENVAFGLTTCGAVMVPCPWFLELAAYCCAHPQADVGVHLTLTAEWKHYRWGPISTRDRASGLLDAEGYLPRTNRELHAQMDAQAAIREMRAQVQRALDAGIDVTHIDTHMGSVQHPQLVAAYIQLGLDFRVPVMLPRMDEASQRARGATPEMIAASHGLLAKAQAAGLPILDGMAAISLQPGEDALMQYQRAFEALPPGIVHFLYHPALQGGEIEAITDHWTRQVGDYRTFQSEEMRAFFQRSGIKLIGYRALREAMRNAKTPGVS
jgi:hypothetical protein